ncbi:MAG: amino-acid N-acetyltransferase [Verrucomicrobia bacterium]|nr:amino-acid N-acetyltransferase [Verrucomicrobiota bacterium]
MKPTDLRGILHYIPQFREKTFVIAMDGAIVAEENFANILLDIAVLRSLNIDVVLVHGASALVRLLARERGVTPSSLDGTGITDAQTLALTIKAANLLTHEVLEGLAALDLRAACTNGITAHPAGILQGVDQLFTGKVERVDIELFRTLLDQRIIPVVPPLGFDGDGRTYRVNSDHVAVALAEALHAVKILFITTCDGLFQQGRLIRQMPVGDLDQILATRRQDILPEMMSKAVHAAAACHAGIPRVHLINGRVEEGLLAEVFSNEGIGTLIYANEYQQVRRAMKKDVRHLQQLTKQAMASDELVKRTRADIEKTLQDYYIFEIDRNPVACVALHPYRDQHKGELASLYVSPPHENQGIGRKLIQFAENKARELGLDELFALSTQAFTYFQSKGGFVEGSPDTLPPGRREKYEQSGRHSKVLVKRLARPASPPGPET